MATDGKVFHFDMGTPARNHDLARYIILLSGLTLRERESDADGDISIEEVDLRPVKKLHGKSLIEEQLPERDHPAHHDGARQLFHPTRNRADALVPRGDGQSGGRYYTAQPHGARI